MSDEVQEAIARVTASEPRGRLELSLIVILSDGIRGHVNQSRGVALWLERISGAEIVEIDVPVLRGYARAASRRAARKMLMHGNRRLARDWLALSDGGSIVRELGQVLMTRGIREGEPRRLALISAGTSAAMYNIALGYIWRCTCITIMTPSVIGTEPFDFAVVPEHDSPKEAANVLATLGAPGLIVREELEHVASSLLREHPPLHKRRWGVLIGGDDRNYVIDGAWIKANVGAIMSEAQSCDTDLYITTSRRTSAEAEDALRRCAARCPNVRFMLLASQDSYDPVPAILGACDEVFVTDDSVNMVSEAITAGHRAVLMRASRRGGLGPSLSRAAAKLASRGVIPARLVWGAPRFDAAFERFKEMGLLVEFEDRLANGAEPPADRADTFNEARRAAEWIAAGLRTA